MHIDAVNDYFRNLFSFEDFTRIDNAINGLQVERKQKEIKKIAFAVDACIETFKRAVNQKSDMLFVHHGLFWGKQYAIKGMYYKRFSFLIENDLALYAEHLPLDMHPDFGNNIGIAKAIGLNNIEPFGSYKGKQIGWMGNLDNPVSIDSVLESLSLSRSDCIGVLPFGKKEIKTIGIVSGGAPLDVSNQAIDFGLDLYITGDGSHETYHAVQESALNVIFGGHYATETWGVKALSKITAKDTGLETIFIDVPTGL